MSTNLPQTDKERIVAGYARVSEKNDKDEARSVSIDYQIEFLKEWCNREKWKLDYMFVDEFKAGKDMNRQGLIDALDYAEQGAYQYLLVYHNDRLTRNLSDLIMLLKTFDTFKVSLLLRVEDG